MIIIVIIMIKILIIKFRVLNMLGTFSTTQPLTTQDITDFFTQYKQNLQRFNASIFQIYMTK